MKISAQEEYGIRLMLRILLCNTDGQTIAKLSEAEELSKPYVAKLTRKMRLAGLIQSQRGQNGGYILSKPAEQISMHEIFKALGGNIYDLKFTEMPINNYEYCTNSVDCTIQTLWKMMQVHLENMLKTLTLADLIKPEGKAKILFDQVIADKFATV